MTTKEVVEALLVERPDLRPILKALHIVNDTDRNWTAQPHKELNYFLRYFKRPKFLSVIMQQIHIFMIGEIDKGSRYHIIRFEGYGVEHLILNKAELTDKIKEYSKENFYLPDCYRNRIIVVTENGGVGVFNRMSSSGNMFYTKSIWTWGADAIYDADDEKDYEKVVTPEKSLSKEPQPITASDILDMVYKMILFEKGV